MNVLITGAGGGLGRMFAAECAKRKFDLFLTDINAPALEAISADIKRQYPVTVRSAVCDLTSAESVRAMLDEAAARGIAFNMLFNVAGVDFEGAFAERTEEQISEIIEVNIAATLGITHEILLRRPKDKKFYIVFVSSLAALYPMPLKACYAASKRFLYDFACALGSELESSEVSVTSLCPGGLATTKTSIEGIAAQGLWGRLTSNPLETVARRTVTKALRGHRVYIPGVINRMLAVLGKFAPRSLIIRVIRSRWQKARTLRGFPPAKVVRSRRR